MSTRNVLLKMSGPSVGIVKRKLKVEGQETPTSRLNKVTDGCRGSLTVTCNQPDATIN